MKLTNPTDINNRPKMDSKSMFCSRCGGSFEEKEKIVNSAGELFHQQCFVCSQCFRRFGHDEIFYEFEGRKYCEHDFHVLYAPSCRRCKEFIIGRVIKALNTSWHPMCFCCDLCDIPLADQGFIKNGNRSICHDCNNRLKAEAYGKYICYKCKTIIDDSQPLKYKNEPYHPYHFNCTGCGTELNSDAREIKEDLYCLPCHDKMGIPICGGCHKPIETRIVIALGKKWHVDHFVCAKCEKPFLGSRHYEKKGLAYCETHYFQLFGSQCHVCNQLIRTGDVYTALNKTWCVDHFSCDFCGTRMNERTKFYDIDLKPCCKICYNKFPSELKKRLKKQYVDKVGSNKGIM